MPPNRYSDRQETRPMWRTTFQYALVPGRSLDLYLPDEPSAKKVAPKGPVEFQTLFSLLAPFNARFTVTSIAQDQHRGPPNRYTDHVAPDRFWHTLMWSEKTDRYADLWYGPSQADNALASQWAFNVAYGPLDLPRALNILVMVPELRFGPGGKEATLNLNELVRVTFYPAAQYVAEVSVKGFIDGRGYHRPGIYPAGFYPAGIELGEVINLQQPTVNLGVVKFITIGTALELSARLHIPLAQWAIVIFG